MTTSPLAIVIFCAFVGVVLGLSWFLGRQAKSANGFFAAHGQVPWFVNGIAFAGDYLSAASFLGICGMIAFYGYDGFLYSIGFLAGWVVALFVVAEPMKRLGKYTFADALAAKFASRSITLTAAIATLVISTFYLIPQMVGAGALIKPLLGLEHWVGVTIVGTVVVIIVSTAGMVSTTWVQFIKGGLLVLFCGGLTIAILARGLTTNPYAAAGGSGHSFATALSSDEVAARALADGGAVLPADGAWSGKPYQRTSSASGAITLWRMRADGRFDEAQYQEKISASGSTVVLRNGLAQGRLWPVGHLSSLPGGAHDSGGLGPLAYLETLHDSTVVRWTKDDIRTGTAAITAWYPISASGAALMVPGNHPLFAGIKGNLPPPGDDTRWSAITSRLDFISLMLALFLGTASLPHILIRYYTVKDAVSARKSTVVGIAAIGVFYVLTLFIGLAAMTSGTLNPSDSNLSAPLLAKSLGELPFACICAIAFTTVLGTVSGLIMAAAGAIVHDLATTVAGLALDDATKVRWAKSAAIVVGVIGIALGIKFETMNVAFLVAWAFAIAASANLPSLVMLLFWKGTTKQGITAAVLVGLVTSLTWVLMSKDALEHLYGFSREAAAAKVLVPFSQPALVTVPLGFAVLIVVSLLTRRAQQPRPG